MAVLGFMLSASLLCSLCASTSIFKDPTVPGKAIMWTLGGTEVESNAEYRTQTMDKLQLARYLKDSIKSKEVFVYLKKEDGTSLLSTPWIASSIKSSSGAIVVSNLYATSVTDRSLLEHFQSEGILKTANHISLSQLREMLVGSSSPLQNGGVDTYVVSMTGSESEEKDFQSISRLVQSSSVMLLIADETSAIVPEKHAEYAQYSSRILSSQFSTAQNATWEGGEYSIYYQGKYLYITPDIFTGVLTGLFFFFILMTGFNCLGAIQGPGTFANKLPPLGKEA